MLIITKKETVTFMMTRSQYEKNNNKDMALQIKPEKNNANCSALPRFNEDCWPRMHELLFFSIRLLIMVYTSGAWAFFFFHKSRCKLIMETLILCRKFFLFLVYLTYSSSVICFWFINCNLDFYLTYLNNIRKQSNSHWWPFKAMWMNRVVF